METLDLRLATSATVDSETLCRRYRWTCRFRALKPPPVGRGGRRGGCIEIDEFSRAPSDRFRPASGGVEQISWIRPGFSSFVLGISGNHYRIPTVLPELSASRTEKLRSGHTCLQGSNKPEGGLILRKARLIAKMGFNCRPPRGHTDHYS